MSIDFLTLVRASIGYDVVHFDAEETIFREGGKIRWLYQIASGRVRLSRTLPRGHDVVVASYGAGQMIAEASLFAPRYHCDSVAESRSQLHRYSIVAVKSLLDYEPPAVTGLAIHLAAQVRELRTQIELRKIRRADERLLAWLRLQVPSDTFELSGTWLDIARQIGLTGEAIYRALSSLERRGAISRNGRIVKVAQKRSREP